MNKRSIVESVAKRIKLSTEDKEIMNEIEKAKQAWEDAIQFFDVVKEPDMVDYAIYLQQAASVRYMHLLKMAKERNLSAYYYDGMKELDIR